MSAPEIYGYSLWAFKESKPSAIFDAYVELAHQDARRRGADSLETIAMIDDVTPLVFDVGRSPEQQIALTDKYRAMLLDSGFDSVKAYTTMGVDMSPKRLFEVMSHISITDFYTDFLPPYKRTDRTLPLSHISISVNETNMLAYGVNELNISTYMFGPRTRKFANWLQQSSLLSREVRTIFAPEIA